MCLCGFLAERTDVNSSKLDSEGDTHTNERRSTRVWLVYDWDGWMLGRWREGGEREKADLTDLAALLAILNNMLLR